MTQQVLSFLSLFKGSKATDSIFYLLEHNKEKDLKTLIKMTQDLRQRFAETNMTSKEITNEEMQTDDNIQHPASAATYWVSKWVDYSDKYGIGKSSFSSYTV